MSSRGAGEDASYKAASDVYIDLNIQYALTVFSKIYKETGKTCELLVPDGPVQARQEGRELAELKGAS